MPNNILTVTKFKYFLMYIFFYFHFTSFLKKIHEDIILKIFIFISNMYFFLFIFCKEFYFLFSLHTLFLKYFYFLFFFIFIFLVKIHIYCFEIIYFLSFYFFGKYNIYKIIINFRIGYEWILNIFFIKKIQKKLLKKMENIINNNKKFNIIQNNIINK